MSFTLSAILREQVDLCLAVVMPMASLITLRNVRFDGFNVASLCQVLRASYVAPGLGEGAAVNFVSVYEMRDEAAQIIPLAFSAVAGQQRKDPRRKDVDTRRDKAGAWLCRLLLELNYAAALQGDDSEPTSFAPITDIIDRYQGIFPVVRRDEVSQVKLEVVIAGDDEEVFGDVLAANPELKRADGPLHLLLTPDIFNAKLYLPGHALLPPAEISFKLPVARYQCVNVLGNPAQDMAQQRLAVILQQCFGFVDGQRIKPGAKTTC